MLSRCKTKLVFSASDTCTVKTVHFLNLRPTYADRSVLIWIHLFGSCPHTVTNRRSYIGAAESVCEHSLNRSGCGFLCAQRKEEPKLKKQSMVFSPRCCRRYASVISHLAHCLGTKVFEDLSCPIADFDPLLCCRPVFSTSLVPFVFLSSLSWCWTPVQTHLIRLLDDTYSVVCCVLYVC